MAFSIQSLQLPRGNPIAYDDAFRVTMESMLLTLRTHPETNIIPIEPYALYKYEGDLLSLFVHLGIPVEMHHLVMRVNNLENFAYVPSELTSLLVPSEGYVRILQQLHSTTAKKTTS